MKFYKNIKLLYVIIFFQNLIPAYVIERLFWEERGMNVQMVVYCEIIYAFTIIILEIPSGVLADKFGRKNLIIIGRVLSFVEFILLIYAYNFWQFSIVVLLAGIGGACTSGAWNSLIYDSLKKDNRQDEFEKILGKILALDFFASIIAALSGGVFAKFYGFLFNYEISAFSAMVSLVFALVLVEPPRNYNDESKQVIQIIKQAIGFFKRNKKIGVLIIQGTVIAACINYIYEFWQIYLNNINFPIALFGIVSSLFALVRIPASIITNLFIKYFKKDKLILFMSFLICFSILASSFAKNIMGIFSICIALFAYSILDLVITGSLHHKVDNHSRATIESVKSLCERCFSVIIGLFFSLITDKLSIFSGFMVLGIACLMVTVIYKFKLKTK